MTRFDRGATRAHAELISSLEDLESVLSLTGSLLHLLAKVSNDLPPHQCADVNALTTLHSILFQQGEALSARAEAVLRAAHALPSAKGGAV
ncbi:hypothetical protein [Pseudovibrio sp. POLY-S9]|uniref:hypothetical protein n=1 Tax=Pseudovibrio sp. POLY-S9 TaxID=1576596 RepID=UPI00070B162F|nr:hypothetical protein [Pseudovibrio sp. POLY-S9]